MSKPGQVLEINPQHELKFRGPFNVPVTSYMKLINPTDKKVFFKIKTTAPKKYCVRPNSGSIDGKGVVEIAICLQPFIYDPLEKNRHKFMVQTVIAPEGENNIEALWKDLQPDQLMDSKLKCVFEVPETATSISNQSATGAASPEVPDGGSGEYPNASNIGDSNKVPPKVEERNPMPMFGMYEYEASARYLPSTSVSVQDAELHRAAAEVKQLREEESSLRQENLQLKEELLRLRRSTSGSASTHGRDGHHNSYNPPSPQVGALPPFIIIACILTAVFGIILGKFIL